MSYKCLRAFVAKLEQVVDSVIEDGTAQTVDGKWRLPLDELAGRGGDCSPELIRAMLAEREEIIGIEEDQGIYHIDFQPEFCAYKQRELFDPERMRTTAVYTLEEADGPHHFYTEHAGGYSLAYQVSELLEEARRGLADEISAAELMPLLVSDYHFLTEKARLFAPLTESEAQRYLAAGDGKIAYHIKLDLSADTVHMRNLPEAAECSLPALTLSLHGRGFTCEKLYKIASSPESCFACDENVEMDMSKLHEKVFRQTILHNLQTFEKVSRELENLPRQRQDEQAQDGMALA